MKTKLNILLLFLMLGPGTAFAQSHTLLTTLTNPTPAFSDFFGVSVAGVGNDRVLVGTDSGGAAYLFSTSGKLLQTFTISDPAAGGFGNPAVAVGDNGMLIGAYSYGTTAQNGRVYLFNTNGLLRTTFTNPNPARVQAFGFDVAAFGTDRVLISGPADANKGAPYLGAGYLYDTNGALLATFTNPAPANFNGFGYKIAAIGTDRVAMSANSENTGAAGAGVVYLYNTNGLLQTTFTNPVPVVDDGFGTGLAALGSDRLLISAVDYGGHKGGGSAYLFNTNGTLSTTFTNPTPAIDDLFGWSVAAVGNDRVLIGAYQDSLNAFHSGAAYLFSTNGTLLNTFTNPTPGVYDDFGWSVAAVGNDRVIIGALFDDTGATDSGAAYLFDLTYPSLTIAHNASTVSLQWTTPETGLALQQMDAFNASPVWSNSTNSVSVNGLTNVVQQPLTTGITNRFYRLKRP